MAEEWTMPAGNLMTGKRGLIMGVANDHSIAWGIAKQIALQGGEMAFTYQGEALEKRVRPLIESIGGKLMVPADVTDDASMDQAFATVEKAFGRLDFVVHSIAFSDKETLRGSFIESTSRAAFLKSMDVSAFSFVDVCRRAAPLMGAGGSIIAMTYQASERVVPNYNMMGVSKAALEAAVRYVARDLGPRGIRVNALSPGPMRTLAMAGIAGGRQLMKGARDWSLLREDTSMEGVAGAALWLLSDLGRSTAGEVIHVDAGFHVVAVPEGIEGT